MKRLKVSLPFYFPSTNAAIVILSLLILAIAANNKAYCLFFTQPLKALLDVLMRISYTAVNQELKVYHPGPENHDGRLGVLPSFRSSCSLTVECSFKR